MKISHHILLSLGLVFILTSCIGSSPSAESDEGSGLVGIEKENFTMKVPSSWEEKNISQMPNPPKGNVELVYASKKIGENGFRNNMIIVSDARDTDVLPKDLIEQSVIDALQEYASFFMLKNEEIVFEDGSKSKIIAFHSQYNSLTEEQFFIQTAQICGDTLYSLTFGLDKNTPVENYINYKKIFSSFSCN